MDTPSKIIGTEGTFIRHKWDEGQRGIKEHRSYTGTIMDKVQVVEMFEGRPMKVDKYVVWLPDGIVELFYPSELKRYEQPRLL